MVNSVEQKKLPPLFQRYIAFVQHDELAQALSRSLHEITHLVTSIPEDRGTYRYAAGKWSIKEVLCHTMDTEHIFAYRALRFARQDKTPLAGFEENDYAPRANAHSRTLHALRQEMTRLRATTEDLFNSFTPHMLQQTGSANNLEMSVSMIGYLIAGHTLHHARVLQERYL